jgi:hypothetical protein
MIYLEKQLVGCDSMADITKGIQQYNLERYFTVALACIQYNQSRRLMKGPFSIKSLTPIYPDKYRVSGFS